MEVKLISMTQAVFGVQMTSEQLIVYTARVSNPTNQMNMETADKLLAYLIKNKHWSPFDMVDMTVQIVTSRAIAQQVLRHWSFRFQEFSQRYSMAVAMEEVQLRLQAGGNHQGGEETLDERKAQYYEQRIKETIELANEVYVEMIGDGIAKECARMVLPMTTQTTMYMKGSVRSWIHYLQQRTDPHAQTEHRQVAYEVMDIFKTHFPNIAKSL